MELDGLVSSNLKKKRGDNSSPIYLEIENESIVELFLVSCRLSSIPRVVCEFKMLKELDLDRNAVNIIPSTIENLSFLEVLSLSDNNLGVFPEPLTKLISLQSLNLADNRITSMPSSIGDLKHLRHLALTNNHIEVMGEHIMSSIGPLKLYQGLFVADEVITNFRPRLNEWVATLILKGKNLEEVLGKKQQIYDNIRDKAGHLKK